MSEIVWEEPPGGRPGGRPSGVWLELLTPLMKHPGKWAMVMEKDRPEQAGNIAANLRSGVTKRPPGRWEFAARKADNGKGKIYARYLGPEE